MSHFSAVGFPIRSTEAMLKLARRVPASARFAETEVGAYYRWQTGGGSELWLGLGLDQSLKSVVPFFASSLRTRVRVVDRRPSAEHEMEGSLLLVVGPAPLATDGDPLAGVCTLIVDVPDYRRLDALVLPLEFDMSICGVAERLEHYASEADLHAAEPDASAASITATALRAPLGEEPAPKRAEAVVYGTVQASGMRSNAVGGGAFTWARLKTRGMELEVVADPALLAKPPVVGSILGGTFWITARVATAWPDPITGRL